MTSGVGDGGMVVAPDGLVGSVDTPEACSSSHIAAAKTSKSGNASRSATTPVLKVSAYDSAPTPRGSLPMRQHREHLQHPPRQDTASKGPGILALVIHPLTDDGLQQQPPGDPAAEQRPSDVRALALRLAVSVAICRSRRPGSDSPRGSGTAICAIRLPCWVRAPGGATRRGHRSAPWCPRPVRHGCGAAHAGPGRHRQQDIVHRRGVGVRDLLDLVEGGSDQGEGTVGTDHAVQAGLGCRRFGEELAGRRPCRPQLLHGGPGAGKGGECAGEPRWRWPRWLSARSSPADGKGKVSRGVPVEQARPARYRARR